MKLSKAKLYTFIAMASAASQVAAENYRYEVSAGLSDGDVEVGGLSGDTESFDLGFTTNFSQVDTSKGPLAEAEFLDRASNITIGYSDGELENIDTDDLAANLRLVDKESGFTGELFLSDGEIGGADNESLGLSLGYYVAPNTEVALGFLNTEVDNIDADTIFAGIKHVSTGEVSFMFEGILGSVDTDAGDDTLLTLSGTIYPNRQLGIGASYTTIDSDVDNDTFMVFADWFVTPNAAVSLGYSDSEVGAIESDSVSVSGRLRF